VPDWVCSAGGTLLIPSGAQGNHLFVILNDPTDFDGYAKQSCVSVSLCSIRKGPYDATRIAKARAHAFLTQDSYVAYRHARIDAAEDLTRLVKNLSFVPLEPVSSELLNQIRDGLYVSPQTPNYIKELKLA